MDLCSVPVFGVRVSVKFHLMCDSSVWLAVWPPFGRELLTRLTICSLCVLTVVILSISRFDFEGGICVPGHCILVTFCNMAHLLYDQILEIKSSSNNH